MGTRIPSVRTSFSTSFGAKPFFLTAICSFSSNALSQCNINIAVTVRFCWSLCWQWSLDSIDDRDSENSELECRVRIVIGVSSLLAASGEGARKSFTQRAISLNAFWSQVPSISYWPAPQSTWSVLRQWAMIWRLRLMFGMVMVQESPLEELSLVQFFSLAWRWILGTIWVSRFMAQNPCSQIGVFRVYKLYGCLRALFYVEKSDRYWNGEYSP